MFTRCDLKFYEYVPILASSAPQYQNIRVGLIKDSLLMGIFPLSHPPPISPEASVNMISTSSTLDKGKSIAYWTSVNPFEEMYQDI